MDNIEIKLFFELCKFKGADEEKMKQYISEGAATPTVLGHLCSNRMAAVAYGTLKKAKQLSAVDREFRNTLKNAYIQNCEKNKSYFRLVEILQTMLAECEGKYALLKGAWLCGIYPEGYRTSNDADILVDAKDVTLVGNSLLKNGFQQGYIRNDEFIPATRSEIISSKIMRGETVPYVKRVDLPYIKYFEVDINFSLDYKNTNDGLVADLISRARKTPTLDFEVLTLEKYDFALHLCGHLYKEATTYPWIKMKRDMTLYKFCDLYMLLLDYQPEDFDKLFKRISEMGMFDIGYYALYMMRELFDVDNTYLSHCINLLEDRSNTVLDTVVCPSEHRTYRYLNSDIKERFFTKDRTGLLKEVSKDAKAAYA